MLLEALGEFHFHLRRDIKAAMSAFAEIATAHPPKAAA